MLSIYEELGSFKKTGSLILGEIDGFTINESIIFVSLWGFTKKVSRTCGYDAVVVVGVVGIAESDEESIKLAPWGICTDWGIKKFLFPLKAAGLFKTFIKLTKLLLLGFFFSKPAGNATDPVIGILKESPLCTNGTDGTYGITIFCATGFWAKVKSFVKLNAPFSVIALAMSFELKMKSSPVPEDS